MEGSYGPNDGQIACFVIQAIRAMKYGALVGLFTGQYHSFQAGSCPLM